MSTGWADNALTEDCCRNPRKYVTQGLYPMNVEVLSPHLEQDIPDKDSINVWLSPNISLSIVIIKCVESMSVRAETGWKYNMSIKDVGHTCSLHECHILFCFAAQLLQTKQTATLAGCCSHNAPVPPTSCLRYSWSVSNAKLLANSQGHWNKGEECDDKCPQLEADFGLVVQVIHGQDQKRGAEE